MPGDESTLDARFARTGVIRIAERVLRRASVPVLLVVGIVTAVPGNWLRVQNVDPQFSMVLVQRTIHFGGTFFDNAVQDHGPLEIGAREATQYGQWRSIAGFAVHLFEFALSKRAQLGLDWIKAEAEIEAAHAKARSTARSETGPCSLSVR